MRFLGRRIANRAADRCPGLARTGGFVGCICLPAIDGLAQTKAPDPWDAGQIPVRTRPHLRLHLSSWLSNPRPNPQNALCYLDVLRRELIIVALFVVALRLPFLNQPIQGDDINYLYGAEHAQIDPLHPTHARYAFMSTIVDMRGHPHPPLIAWYLALLLTIFKDISEVPFHAAYILFSLIAGF